MFLPLQATKLHAPVTDLTILQVTISELHSPRFYTPHCNTYSSSIIIYLRITVCMHGRLSRKVDHCVQYMLMVFISSALTGWLCHRL